MKEEYYDWPAELLVKTVIKSHHSAILAILAEIRTSFAQFVLRYKVEHDIEELYAAFKFFVWKQEVHIHKEAIAIIPFVTRYSSELKKRSSLRMPGFHSACHPIHEMYKEHKIEKQRFNLLLELMEQIHFNDEHMEAHFRKIHVELLKFRKYWHDQVLLENDILFPKIVEMEALLNQCNP
ncbi:hypothetical protein GCM10009122_59730 [Fulvivirga kasyanovii]|uniref:Hemerythrin-like domain-containing protein n=1 Tax=Fulvivirga kasyanovii TaxID=396812 RepID=A0ABW9RVE1_9BACT|nr:hypothetical protein [Fulvivirga kasyanovii]MTI27214.1 hypothetical protein [Fulvivirga kasyanovii]